MDKRARERWLEIDGAFASALACPEHERDALLARIARDDEDLARSVRALLAAEPLAEAALGESASAFAIPLVQAEQQAGREGDPTAVAGTRLGAYRVIAEIGRGGMGAVYLAERADDQFEKRVAIKLVKRGMDTDEVLRRFRYERQILASLEHPNIARLYDGGVSDDGRPYLVMEYVDGQPLDAYCDRLALTVERRLALFRSACAAVQYAHQNLVIHRDLKPSNILVTPDGTIKLLDFGIAKLLQPDVADDTLTRPELRAFTPEFASPEQLFGRPATTASDVYGLGVVLHQLLAGRRVAHHALADRLQTSREQAERLPERPSDAARAAGMVVATARGTTRERLVKRLEGDLDAIVLTALENEPQRRYESPGALAADIERHLTGAPVRARRATTAYRLWRYAQRHRARVAVAVTFSILVVAFPLYYGARVARERDRAQRQRDKAEQVVGFLTGMLTAADPNKAQGDTLTVFDVLARSEQRLDTALSGQPAVQEELRRVLGTTYHELGDYPKARRHLERAYALGMSLRGETDSVVGATASSLAKTLETLGVLDSAERTVRRVLELRRARYGDTSSLVASSLNQLGELRQSAGDLEEGARLIGQALAINRRRGAAREELATNLSDLGRVMRSLGRHAEAEALLREALALRERTLGMKHPSVPATMIALGSVLRERGHYLAAESLFRASLDIRRRVLGADHPDIVASLIGLAYAVEAQHKYAESESLFGQAIDMNRRILGADNTEVGMDLIALGEVFEERGDVTRAKRLLKSALDLFERSVGQEHSRTIMAVVALGRLHVESGSPRAGERLLRRAVATRTAKNGPTHYMTLWARADLGWSLAKQRRFVEAESVLVETHAAWRPRPGIRDSMALRRLRENIVDVSVRLSKPAQADVIAECRLLKLGKRLAVGEVTIYSAGDPEPVAHATVTYSIPPQQVSDSLQPTS